MQGEEGGVLCYRSKEVFRQEIPDTDMHQWEASLPLGGRDEISVLHARQRREGQRGAIPVPSFTWYAEPSSHSERRGPCGPTTAYG
ncbi:Chromosomal replication initiator protein DnaA [Clarias magur]|uniref:Chromosomal replication initiator protein DnaA n=1 Tax=Clarias magur TaxID=1594786 RepID=A0A8J4TBT4_CLAMG|nr:Chromosomal replication initiator protein DnaA [Clarias magur]